MGVVCVLMMFISPVIEPGSLNLWLYCQLYWTPWNKHLLTTFLYIPSSNYYSLHCSEAAWNTASGTLNRKCLSEQCKSQW